jgi:hypothetical protein
MEINLTLSGGSGLNPARTSLNLNQKPLLCAKTAAGTVKA